MDNLLIVTIAIIALALFFDFLNGFHDAANSIATIVSTRVLTPRQAVVWAAIFNFIAFLVFGLHVASTIGKGIVDINIIDYHIIFGALMGASIWNIITWYLGLPSSSSHALMGGLIGAAIAKAGPSVLIYSGINRTIAFMVISPFLGLVLALFIAVIVYNIFAKYSPAKIDVIFRKGQIISAALYSLGHGGNDAQKTMGIITSLLFSSGYLRGEFHIPLWVVLSCHAAIALGTLFGGWRIVKTLGHKISKLRPVDGFCAETASATSLYIATGLGIPVSTTHTITGAILGVGSIKRFSAVKWGVAGKIVWAWIITIPAASLISALTYILTSKLF